MDVEKSRQLMLQQQLRAGGVLDARVLATVESVRREEFVPASHRGVAFADTAIPLPCSQSMMTPLQEGLLLQSLAPRPLDRVLEVGTGSGYLAACLARLTAHVTSIEIFPELAESARAAIGAAGIRNCEVVVGDAYTWTPEPADVLAITGSLPAADASFEGWLRPGGRLFQVVGTGSSMYAWLIHRRGDTEYERQRLFETSLPPLLNARQPQRFHF